MKLVDLDVLTLFFIQCFTSQSTIRTGFPGLNQYYSKQCSRTQHSEAGDAPTRGPLSQVGHTVLSECACLFDLILSVSVNNFSIMSKPVFLG